VTSYSAAVGYLHLQDELCGAGKCKSTGRWVKPGLGSATGGKRKDTSITLTG